MVAFLLLSLFLALLSVGEADARTHPKYSYNDLQIYHLKEREEVLPYNERYLILPYLESEYYSGQNTMTFDENGNLLSISYGNRVENFKYSRKGYKIRNREKHNEYEIGDWIVSCDTTLRVRMDISQYKYPRDMSYAYTFDIHGKHTSTLYKEKGLRVLILFHYPEDGPFRPGKLWKGTDPGRSRGDKGSIWYIQKDENGAWRAEVHEGNEDDTYYYTAHYVINGDGCQGEGVIIRYKLHTLKQYLKNHSWESRQSARTCKAGRTEFEKAISGLGVFDASGEIMLASSETSPIGEALRCSPTGKLAEKGEKGTVVSVLGQTIDKRFLFEYISIPLNVQTILSNILCAILCLVALFYIMTFKERYPCTGMAEVVMAKVFILFFSICELAVFYLCPDAEPFLSKLNGIWSILPLATLLILFVGQLSSMVRLMDMGNEFSGRNAPLAFLHFGFIIFTIALIASLIFEDIRPYALAIGFGAILVQIVIDLIATIVNHSNFGGFLLNSLWMIVCGSAIMLLAYGFAVLFVIVFIGYAILSGLAHSGEPCCANCRTYSNGYCHYRNESRSGGDYCSKHIW